MNESPAAPRHHPAEPSRAAGPGRVRRTAAGVAALAAGATLAGLALGAAGSRSWVLDLFAHFRVQYALALLMCSLLLVAAGAPRRGAACLALAAGVGASLGPFFLPRSSSMAPPGAEPITIVHFNVLAPNPNRDGVLDYLEGLDADLIALQEIDDAWMGGVRGRAAWEVVADASQPGNFGMVLLRPRGGRAQIERVGVVDLTRGTAPVPAIEARVLVGGRPTSMLFVHTTPPIRARHARLRDVMLAETARWAASQDLPALIVGDLNATPWSHAFRGLLRDAGLRNTMAGRGLSPTWPARLPGVCRIPIDHCLATPGWTVAERAIGPRLGSDHLPLVITLTPPARSGS